MRFMTVSKQWSSAEGIIEWHAGESVKVTEFAHTRSLPTRQYKTDELFTMGRCSYVVDERGNLYSLESVGFSAEKEGWKQREFVGRGVLYRAYLVE